MRAVVLASLIACGGGGGPTAGPVGKRLGPALAAALTAADQERLPWRCAAADLPGLLDETLTIGKRKWKLSGHALATDLKDLEIGVIADAGGAAPATLASLGRQRGALDKVDLVIVLGGMGATQAKLEATL
ncbi:MAG: hypothetical protein H0T79_02880, partial [Deltaproteobacteria bacterium]|nr:hypothetical protein [Deltaproteobacteria bacterium]